LSERGIGLRIAKQSAFTYAMFALSASTLAFTSIQGGSNFFGEIVALFLILTGVVGAEVFKVRKEDLTRTTTDEVTMGTFFVLLALTLFMFFDYLVPRIIFSQSTVTYDAFWGQFSLPLNATVNVSWIPAWFPALVFIAVLIPNAEEQFFRGFWGNLAVARLGGVAGAIAFPLGAVLGTGASIFIALVIAASPAGVLFGLFHTPAYNGSLPIIVALSADGTIVIALNSIVGRLDISIGAHMLNNAMSFAVQQSSVLALIPNLPPSPIHMILPLVMPGVLLGVAVLKRRRR